MKGDAYIRGVSHESASAPPDAAVLRAFGVTGRAQRLTGGTAHAWRVGDLVLKPLDKTLEELNWQFEVLTNLQQLTEVRIAVPIRSKSAELAVAGWTGWPALAGSHAPRWQDIIAAGQQVHEALRDVRCPRAILDARTGLWAEADRVAWRERPLPARARVPEIVGLLDRCGPVRTPAQLVHGDLTGNVLFADGLAPAIIDFTPYWRPCTFASAVVAIDAVTWCDGGHELLSLVAAAHDGTELLRRALLFRLLAHPRPPEHLHRFKPTIDFIEPL